MASTQLPNLSRPLSGLSYDQQWELLKPAIEQLYVDENLQLTKVVLAVRARYGFIAHEAHYKYQIKKWKMKKNTSKDKKAAICRVVKSRAQQGKTSVIKRGSKDFDTKNLQRYLKAEAKKAIELQPVSSATVGDPWWSMMSITSFGNMIFMNWNMPYGVPALSTDMTVDHPSPMSDIEVATPPSNHDAPSSMAVTVKEITAIDRARLFVEGRHDELLQSMRGKQRAIMSTWMYQFWLLSFKTAKHWGKGPREWTAEMLGFDDPRPQPHAHFLPDTTGSAETPGSRSRRSIDIRDRASSDVPSTPTPLCRWSIHCESVEYEELPSPPGSPSQGFDLDDEQSWPAWPGHLASRNIEEKLCDSLENNRFSDIHRKDLPIKMDQVAGAARGSEEIFKESLGFCIMSRNRDLLFQTIRRGRGPNFELSDSGIFPFHLAVSFIDGSRQCCSILESLVHIPYPERRKMYVNDLGHTLLDQLMITILKAHSSCSLNVVDNTINRAKRYEGEEVDICGRWDADSDCLRQRKAKGLHGVPFEWKHMLCHTSVQAVCHCMGVLFGRQLGGYDISIPSGLFVRNCLPCGLKLELSPLHVLVLVGYQLSVSGCDGETLFGIVACLVCLLSHGANPITLVQLSLDLLFGGSEEDECSHKAMDSCMLAKEVFAKHKASWPERIINAWQIVIYVLEQSQAEWKVKGPQDPHGDDVDTYIDYNGGTQSPDSDSDLEPNLPIDCDCDEHVAHDNYFVHSAVLAPLWAAIQTELLTYRRREEVDPWISPNFDMRSLAQGLMNYGKVDILLVQHNMMKDFCSSGRFVTAAPGCPTTDDATTYYFSNLDDWNRSSFIVIDADARDRWHF